MVCLLCNFVDWFRGQPSRHAGFSFPRMAVQCFRSAPHPRRCAPVWLRRAADYFQPDRNLRQPSQVVGWRVQPLVGDIGSCPGFVAAQRRRHNLSCGFVGGLGGCPQDLVEPSEHSGGFPELLGEPSQPSRRSAQQFGETAECSRRSAQCSGETTEPYRGFPEQSGETAEPFRRFPERSRETAEPSRRFSGRSRENSEPSRSFPEWSGETSEGFRGTAFSLKAVPQAPGGNNVGQQQTKT